MKRLLLTVLFGSIMLGAGAQAVSKSDELYEKAMALVYDDKEEEAWPLMTEAAKNGNIYAVDFVVDRLSDVDGDTDYVAIAGWLKIGAESGCNHCMYRLGLCYESGDGVDQNYTKAREYYEKAAALDYADAMNQLAYFYTLGHGVEKDYDKALAYIDKAIENDSYEYNYLDSKGEILWLMGYKKQARQLWRDIRKDNPWFFDSVNSNLNAWCLEEERDMDVENPYFKVGFPDHLIYEQSSENDPGKAYAVIKLNDIEGIMISAYNDLSDTPVETQNAMIDAIVGDSKVIERYADRMAFTDGQAADFVIAPEEEGDAPTYATVQVVSHPVYNYTMIVIRRYLNEESKRQLQHIVYNIRWNDAEMEARQKELQNAKPEYVPTVDEVEMPYKWYEEQFSAWYDMDTRKARGMEAWRNAFQAAVYMDGMRGDDQYVASLLHDMSYDYSDSYDYNLFKYTLSAFGEDGEYAEKALAKLPEKLSYMDYVAWVPYYHFMLDDAKAAEMTKRMYTDGLYPKLTVDYALQLLNGLPKNAIYLADEFRSTVPMWIVQEVLGLHRDKVVVYVPFMMYDAFAERMAKKYGVKVDADADSMDAIKEFFVKLAAQRKAEIYFDTNTSIDYIELFDNAEFESLSFHVTDNLSKVQKNNVKLMEKVYDFSFLNAPMAEDAWELEKRCNDKILGAVATLLCSFQGTNPKAYNKAMDAITKVINRSNLSELEKKELIEMYKESCEDSCGD